MLSKKYRLFLSLSGMLCLGSSLAGAAPTDNLQDSRRQAQERQERLEQPRVQMDGEETQKPVEEQDSGVRFPIQRITIVNQTEKFQWLERRLRAYEGKEYSLAGINNMLNGLNGAIIKRGFTTTRLALMEQNLSAGELRLVLLEGRIGKVRFADGTKEIYWKSAFPFREGDILNIRDIEQGLEQMKRLPSQDVKVKLVPSKQAGFTDIVLNVKQGRNVYGSIAFDDSGLETTGKYQWYGSMSVDNLLHQQDFLRLGVNLDGAHSGYEKGTREQDVFYSIPYGRHTFSISYQQSNYHQQMVVPPITFQNSGESNLTKFTWDYVLHRSASMKTSMDISIRKRNSHSYINDMEIPVQAIHATAVEIGYAERLYLGTAMAYFRLGHRFGVDWLGAQKDFDYEGAPTTHYNMWVVDADFRQPFTFSHRPAVFTSSFHGQWTMDNKQLYGVDMISIGNRYTVRGFSGKYTLMGGSGWFLRNEVASQLPGGKHQIYLGFDVGSVYGKGSEAYNGLTLAGAALGLRGKFADCVSYDMFLAGPLVRPEGFKASDVTGGVQVCIAI